MRGEDLTKYNTSLVRFEEKMVMPMGQIKLLIVMEGQEVMVNFIIVLGTIVDPCHIGHAIHAIKGSGGEGRSKCSLTMLGGCD